MSDQLPKRHYRTVKVIYVCIAFAGLAIAYCLVRGWPFGAETMVWGAPLRWWGYGLAASASIHALFTLFRALLRPGARPTWWG